MDDFVIVGFLGGLLGTVGDVIVHWIFVWLKIAKSTTGHYLSELIFPHEKVSLRKLLLGEFIHLLAGGIFGVSLAVFLLISGYDYALIKGLGLGAATWIVHIAIIPNMVSPRPFIYRTFNETIVDLITHSIWGFVTALVLLIYRPGF
ncbi:MAG: hypothetical protein ACOYVD_11670 [Bacillota bacterium]